MKRAIVFISSVLVSTVCFAQFGGGDTPKQTQIENPNYFCGNDKGAFAFKVSEPPRVWQTELNSQGTADSGLELSVQEIIRIRSPHHFDIKASMQAGSEKIYYHFYMSANHVTKAITLETTISNEKGDKTTLSPMPCSLVPDIPDRGSSQEDPKEEKYSFRDIKVFATCENKLAAIPDFYVLGRLKKQTSAAYQLFFNIEGELTLDKSVRMNPNDQTTIAMGGGFLTYFFDLSKESLSIVNKNGVVAATESCRRY